MNLYVIGYVLLFLTLSSYIAAFSMHRKFQPATRRHLKQERRINTITVYLGIATVATLICAYASS
jgi:hypothetical protein